VANKIFPTGYADVSTTFTLGGFVYVDDGSQNGFVTTDELFKLMLSSSSYVFKEGSPHGVGLVPDPGATGGTTRYLREDGTWDVPPAGSSYTPPGNFGPSGPGHAYGFVPDPGATAGTS